MTRFAATLAAALLGVVMTAISIAVTSGDFLNPGAESPLFWAMAILAIPVALYVGICLRLYLEIIADPDRRAVHAHVFALGLAALFLSVVVSFHGLLQGWTKETVVHFLPRAVSAVMAGCLGLAWGVLWCLPRREEAQE